MEWQATAVLLAIALFVLIAIRLPLGLALIAVALLGTLYEFHFSGQGLQAFLSLLSYSAYQWWGTWEFMAIPMFLLMATLLSHSGVIDDAMDMLEKWTSFMRGQLAVAAIFSGAVFASMSGSDVAAAAAIGKATIPRMISRGYSRSLATGVVACAGSLAHLIPPSVLAILYALVSGVSIGRLFIASLIPGMFLTCFFVGQLYVSIRLNPNLVPLERTAVSWRERLLALKSAGAPMLFIFLVLGTVFLGIATATEAAALGAAGALLFWLSSPKARKNNLRDAFEETARLSGVFSVLILGAAVFGHMLVSMGIPQQLTLLVSSLSASPLTILVGVMLLYIVLGCFLDPGSLILITGPLVVPVITALGFDPLWFGVLFLVNMEMGQITPPVGLALFVVKAVAPEDISFAEIARGALPFAVSDLLLLGLLIAFPSIALWLPSLMG